MLITLFAIAQAAATVPPTSANDGRCLAAFAVLAADKDKQTSEAGIKGVIYFGGKLKGREPNIDLVVVLKTATAGLEPVLQAETLRCNTEFGAFGEQLTAAGNAPD